MSGRYVHLSGARLWTVTSGIGPPLVLLHGGPGSGDDLGPLSSIIDDLVEVHRYEQRACGRSTGGPPFTVEQWVADLEALRVHWGHDRWIVGGHSFGAAVALAYAAAHPERTRAVVYMSCLLPAGAGQDAVEEFRTARLERIPEEDREGWLQLRRQRESGSPAWSQGQANEMVRIGMGAEFLDPALGKDYADRYMRAQINFEVNAQLGADFTSYCEDPRFLMTLRRFGQPVLLLHGEADLRPMWAVEWLSDQLPRGHLVRLPGGHVPWIEAPSELRDALRSFIFSLDSESEN